MFIYNLPLVINSRTESDINFDSHSVRSLVEFYYSIQELRISYTTKIRELDKINSNTDTIAHYTDQLRALESSLKSPLEHYASQSVPGSWALAQYGIGPVYAAGLSAYIDIERASTAGALWRYAGLDSNVKWEKGTKPPFNPELKTLCWKIGNTFSKFSNIDDCFYGQIYKAEKSKRTESNTDDSLQASRIDSQAKKHAVKIFLSHYHTIAYQDHYGHPPANPFVVYDYETGEPLSHIPHNPFKDNT
jgi:hypothetical protein